MKATSIFVAALITFSFANIAGFSARAEDSAATTIKGEVIDLVCYANSGASGEKHSACAGKCISSGLPVGLKGEDGKTYLVVGEHKPMNSELAPYAGKTITLKGKVVSRDGINLIENAQIVAE